MNENIIHQISTTPVYFSKDYKAFTFITGNRKINEKKIKKIISDIDDGLNMLKYCPIVVTKDLKIIDGQHRYFVSKTLKCPVFFVIADEVSLVSVAKINSRTERWKPVDFVNCYVETGNEDYKILKEFIEKYSMPVSSAMHVLTFGLTETKKTNYPQRQFENGEFKVLYLKEAGQILKASELMKDFKGIYSRAFLIAISTLLRIGKCDFSELQKKYLANPEMLQAQSNAKQYLQNIEELYNYRNNKRKTIY